MVLLRINEINILILFNGNLHMPLPTRRTNSNKNTNRLSILAMYNTYTVLRVKMSAM